MSVSVADAVSSAFPVKVGADVDLSELQHELDRVAADALVASSRQIPLCAAVRDPSFPALSSFHQNLQDALFLELPRELESWVRQLNKGSNAPASVDLGNLLTEMVLRPDNSDRTELQRALASVLIFESVRLRLLIDAWQSEEFERLGGDEEDIDAIAWQEVEALLSEPALLDGDVRPLRVMYASSSVALAHDAIERAEALQMTGDGFREQLAMRARLRQALRQLRLPESVLLNNAFSTLLGEDRVELRDLQSTHPLALEGMSRQAMDQRVSRGRRALTGDAEAWPTRRRPALFDLL